MLKSKAPGPICPFCGSDSPISILYGHPKPEAFAAAQRGEIALGGCCIDANSPGWHCRKCRKRY